jgi:hypothetical protein
MKDINSHRGRLTCIAWLTVGALTLGVATPLHGQAVSASLLGTVTDTTGLAVPGAAVTITEVRTNISRTGVTNESGNYSFPNLQQGGVYRVEAELPGFKKVVREDVVVPVNTTVRVDMALEVGELTESVTVSGATPLLQTDRTDTGRIIESRIITDMPLGFNRNFQGALILVPGASRPFRPHSEFFNPQDSLSTNVNGQSRLANNVQIEGIDNNHKTGLLTVLIPSAEAIETVAVTTSNYDAEFGRAGGAVTSVQLKSGTNEFKGSVFAFGNTEATDAKGYFTRAKAPTEYLQAGFTFGGPIRRNKLFFFGDYQHTLDNRGLVRRITIPPMEFRNGDFSQAPTIIYDPATGNADGTGRQPFPGNIVPPDRISPIARRILNLLPPPNIDGAALGQNNYQIPEVRERTTEAFNVKVNAQLSERDSLSVRYSFQRPEIYDPGVFGIYGGGGKGFAGTGTNLTFSTAANWTRTFSPTFLMEARAGGSYYHNEALSEGHGLNTSDELGIPGVNVHPFASGITSINVGGFSNPIVGFANSLPWDRSERTLNFAAVFTKLRGNHTVKFGSDVRHNRDFLLQVQDRGGPRGAFSFGGAQTAIPGNTASINGFANAFAAFLLDAPGSLGRDLVTEVDPGTRHWAMFTFIHDKWQISPRVTLDLGLRHEYYTPLVGLTGRGGLSNYDPATNALRVAGFGSISENLGVESTWTNFAPRTGISFRLNERTVLRAGYGVSIIPFPDNSYAFNFPVKQNNQFNPPNSFATAGSMVQGFPAPIFFDIPSDGVIPTDTPELRNVAFFHVPLDLREGALHSWNVAYQRELPWGFTGEVAYVGNRGQNIISSFNLNAGMTLGADQAGRPLNQQFGRTTDVNTWIRVKNQYHSLQTKLDRRFSHGLLITTSYTLGRSWNYSNGDSNGGISTPIDIERAWGRTDFDRMHSFTQSFVYVLPWGPQGRWLTTGPASWVLGGWQVSGIFAAYSGLPINFTAAAATLRAPGNTQRPNASGTPAKLKDVGPGNLWFDTSVFSAPAQNTFGNVGRNSLLDGPRYVNLDMSIAKQFPFRSDRRAEFRVDAFNILNIPQFGQPGGSLGSANFGQVTGMAGGSTMRSLRFGARFLF